MTKPKQLSVPSYFFFANPIINVSINGKELYREIGVFDVIYNQIEREQNGENQNHK